MPGIIDPETINVDEIPGIWSPVQWELTDEERVHELEDQATASLLWAVDTPEAILRLLLSETQIERSYEAPEGYNPDIQGEWNSEILTFQFKRPIHIERIDREPNYLYIEYKLGDSGIWALEIEPDGISIQRL